MKENFITGFSASNFTLQRNLKGISDSDSVIQPKIKGNCINWNAGHILVVRDQMLTMLDGTTFLSEMETSYYASGSKPIGKNSNRISIEKINQGLKRTFDSLIKKLSGVDEAFLNSPIPRDGLPVPIEDPTMGKLFSILLYHEGYHTGQIGLGRRLIGKEFDYEL
ncbi:DinB family protein [Flagellimonas allohymeniacidonis]|uniref:DinB family protein n=1 Tax=Flagellimonas allohymeniacidonis TaxID=2517819 RepID=A0A4Q8QEY2_9FLAO|nr:DinB family protein [Allomuricauda hymeniacidonis]TAI48384.1 DinB family protein [Allomuricauda hymeniacidonis]